MTKITIYTTTYCPFCVKAKKLLESKKVKYNEIDVAEPAARAKMKALTGGRTVPQILINDQLVGGCDELYALEKSADLDKLLAR